MPTIVHFSTVHRALDSRIFYKELISLNSDFNIKLICKYNNEICEEKNIELIPLKSYNNKLARMIFSPLFALKSILDVKADIYHFHDPELMFTGLILKLMGKHVVYDVHENYRAVINARYWIRGKYLRRIIAEFVWMLDRMITGFYDGIVVARPDLMKLYKRRNIILFRNVPHVERFLEYVDKFSDSSVIKRRANEKIIIYTGGLTYVRGILQTVEAMKYLKGRARLVLLGPWFDRGLEAECRASEGYEYVDYMGYLPYGEHYRYIAEADMGIFPILPVGNHVTNIPNKQFEYMMFKKPVLLSDFPYWKHLFKDDVYYFNPEEPRSIAKAIEYAINDKHSSSKAENAYKRLFTHFNIEEDKKRLIKFYRDILNI